MSNGGNGSSRVTNWLLSILAGAVLAAVGQLWIMSNGVSKMSGTMDEWRVVLEEVKEDNKEFRRDLQDHLTRGEHDGADRRLNSLEEKHSRGSPHWGPR